MCQMRRRLIFGVKVPSPTGLGKFSLEQDSIVLLKVAEGAQSLLSTTRTKSSQHAVVKLPFALALRFYSQAFIPVVISP